MSSLQCTKDQKRKQMQALLRKYETMVEIAAHLGVSRQRVHQKLKQLDIPYDVERRKQKVTEKNRKALREKKKKLFEEARSLYRKGYSMSEIGLELFGHKINPRNRTKPSRICYSYVYSLFRLFNYTEKITFEVDGKTLKQARLRAGLRQTDIGVIGPARMIKLEKGGCGARKETIRKLSRKLQVPFESLVTRHKYNFSRSK